MERFNPRVVVVENAIDERLFRPDSVREPNSGPERVIGYMGTHTHDHDVMMILEPLRDVLRAYRGRVRLELVGASPTPRPSGPSTGCPSAASSRRRTITRISSHGSARTPAGTWRSPPSRTLPSRAANPT